MTPSAPGISRGLAPVARRSFSHWYSSPASSVAVCPARSSETTRRPVTSSAPSAASRQIFSSGAPCHRPFVSSGRLYVGCGSAPIIVIEPSESCSRMPFAAMSPVIPAPMIRYLVVCISALSSGDTQLGDRVEFHQRAQTFVFFRARGTADEVGAQARDELVGGSPCELELALAVELLGALVAADLRLAASEQALERRIEVAAGHSFTSGNPAAATWARRRRRASWSSL